VQHPQAVDASCLGTPDTQSSGDGATASAPAGLYAQLAAARATRKANARMDFLYRLGGILTNVRTGYARVTMSDRKGHLHRFAPLCSCGAVDPSKNITVRWP